MQQNLVTMVNQIGDFFRFQGDEASAQQSIAAHLHHFWAPSMRRDLLACLDTGACEQMHPLVKSTLTAYRDALLNKRTELPGEKQLEEPRGGGDAG